MPCASTRSPRSRHTRCARDDSAGTVTLEHRRARRSPSGSTRSASTSTAPTARPSSRRPPTETAGRGRTPRSTTPSPSAAAVRQEDAFFGLGEKTGRHNRRGRDFTIWNTDVLDPYLSLEFTAGLDPDDPRADRTSTEFDPYYVTIPFFYHQSRPSGAMSASFVDNGYRSHLDFAGREEYAVQVEGGQYTEYVFAGPSMADILEAYTWLTGRMAVPPLWALGYHQCRWFRYDQDGIEDARRPTPRARHPVRRHVAGHRVHGRLPGLHLGPRLVPRPAGDAEAVVRQRVQGHHDHRPRREVRPGLPGLRPGGRGGRAVPHRGRRRLHRPGVARQHRVPGLRDPGGARLVGRAQRRRTSRPAWRGSGTT